MSVYYIDPIGGKPGNDGLSENAPLPTEQGLPLRGGDTVLFKRGSFLRRKLENVSGEEGNPITYGAYGTGAKPVFCGSKDLSDPACWKEEAPGLWYTTDIPDDEACNFIFGDGEDCGTLRWEKEELRKTGDFFDPEAGRQRREKYSDGHRIYLRSDGNPGEAWPHIECAVYGARSLANAGHDMILRDLCFRNSGVHGLAGGPGFRIRIERCQFFKIGGCVWSREQKIRFGNGVEFWEECEDVEICDCLFDDIYDSAVTHQGSGEHCRVAKRFRCRRSIFLRCGMAAYEVRDQMPAESEFTDNVCREAGLGFSRNGVIMPRRSEIWPQPMGHHLFLWRIAHASEGGSLLVTGNRFGSAPYGTAIYSIIDPAAEAQMTVDRNLYESGEFYLFNHFGGVSYPDFDTYRRKTRQEENNRLSEDSPEA